jgi:hypothetical protein
MAQEQSSWILNRLFVSKNRDPGICTSAGGTVKSALPINRLQSDCQVLLQQAGPEGTGKVTNFPSPVKSPGDSGRKLSSLQIGLGVGLPIFASILGVIFVLYMRRKRRVKHQNPPEGDDNLVNFFDNNDNNLAYVKAELEDTAVVPKPKDPGLELDSSLTHEMEAPLTSEMEAPLVYELEERQFAELDTETRQEVKAEKEAEKLGHRGLMGFVPTL